MRKLMQQDEISLKPTERSQFNCTINGIKSQADTKYKQNLIKLQN